jgi:hypothetical protein
MLDDDPDLIESSINALATSLRPERRGGRTVSVVEGIRPKPRSVDWVTEGGAGGRVLRESAHEQEEAVLESMRDEEIEEYLERERPGLLEALRDPDGDGSGNGNRPHEEDQVPEQITPEALTEALADEETRDALIEALRPHISVEVPEGFVRADEVESLVESKMADRSDLLRIEARGDLERQIELRDLRDKATTLVESAKLHPRLAARITEKFSLSETGEPSADLAVIESEYDSDGNLVKGAMEALTEAVTAEVEDAREIMGSLRPTRVKGAGRDSRLTESARKGKESAEPGNDDKPKAKQTTGSSLADELLEGAGFSTEQLGDLWVSGQ